MHWLKELKVRTRFKEPLDAHTTLGIGGRADAWVEPTNFEQLQEIACRCLKQRVPYLVIGKGSNLLFSDQGFRGVVISLSSAGFTKVQFNGTGISCGAGLSLQKLVGQTQKKDWGG